MYVARDYQAEALTAIASSYAQGVWSQVLVLPTGGGKTVVFALLPEALAHAIGQLDFVHTRMLVIAHREELLEQAREKIMRANPGLAVEIEQDEYEASPMADIIVASVSSLASNDCARVKRLGPERIKVIVVDEAHHAPAETYQRVLRALGVLPPLELIPGRGADLRAARVHINEWWQQTQPGKLLLGVTATATRADAIGLEWTFRSVVYEKTLRWMIENGYLVLPIGFAIETGVDLDGVKTVAGDWQTKGLAQAVNTPERNKAIAQEWAKQSRATCGRLAKTLGFAVDIQHAKDLAAAFAQVGARASAVWGADDERAVKVRALNTGQLDALMNCAVLTEGYDEPSIESIVIARPTMSQLLYTQMIGRGLRTHEGKTTCLVFDAADNSTRHSLVALGDLFGLPTGFDLNGGDALQAARQIEMWLDRFGGLDTAGAKSIAEIERRVRAIDVFAPIAAPLVDKYAALRWVQASEQRFYLDTQEKGKPRERVELRLGTLGDWRIVQLDADKSERTIAFATDVRDAFRQGEAWVRTHREHASRMNDKRAAWRFKPPSPDQLAKLHAWGVTTERLPTTRGQASDMMTAYIQRKQQRRSA